MRSLADRTAPAAAPPAPLPFRIGAAADAAEREADAIAARMLGEATLHRRAEGSGAVKADARAAVTGALAAAGRPLTAGDQAFFAPRLGVDLAGVRIHDGPEADRAARSVGARAFALGRDLVFARGAYRPAEAEGRHLLAHELAHVAQQDRATTLRRKNGGGKEEETSAGDVIAEGLKTAAEKAAEKKEVKEKILKPIEDKAKSEFGELSPGETAGVVSFGAATYGLGLGALLGTEKGREMLSDVNFIAPLKLIPYWPISSFTYTLPETETGPLKFKLTFDGTDLLKIGRGENPTWFNSLSLEANWSVDPRTDTWELGQLTGKLGIVKGLTLSGGFKQGPFLTTPSEVVTGPGGEMLQSVKTIPDLPGATDPLKDRPNVGGFITIDFTRLPIVPERIRRVLGGDFGGGR